ncbi:THO complex subunit [Schizosaccharomyces japonicus yFS275]|uniref:THO complex subunit n=1 Tax=Schizosaccharomyces japonicus (strain yFS275 / FY16936) TaxID=402676 RepID=B6K6H8_SCHJY|nr:THO complex subunit [Schizosaccharomyces japonicus yFS275]EEB09132.1 THO complex subunit [Schizosaccharomyces japonicus yFS275]
MSLELSLDEIIRQERPEKRLGRSNRIEKKDSRPKPRRRGAGRRRDYYEDDTQRWEHDLSQDRIESRPRRIERVKRDATSLVSVDNIHYEVSEEELKTVFDRVAPVKNVSMKFDRAGRSEGRCTIAFEKEEDAKLAVAELNGFMLRDRGLHVELLASRRPTLLDRIEGDRIPLPISTKRSRRRTRVHSARPPKTTEELDRELDEYLRNGQQPTPITDQEGSAMEVEND